MGFIDEYVNTICEREEATEREEEDKEDMATLGVTKQHAKTQQNWKCCPIVSGRNFGD